MTTIHLVRHGIAEDQAPGQTDSDRALTAEGQEKTAQMAQGFAALYAFDGIVLASPLRRAIETAEIVADELMEVGEISICEALVPEGSAHELLAFLEHAAPGRDVVAVGHMPSLAEMLADLTGAGRAARLEFRKAAVATIEFEGSPRLGRGALSAFLPPAVLRALGEL